jgi:hypothetical protein
MGCVHFQSFWVSYSSLGSHPQLSEADATETDRERGRGRVCDHCLTAESGNVVLHPVCTLSQVCYPLLLDGF